MPGRGLRGISHCVLPAQETGLTTGLIDPSPTFFPDPENHPDEIWGIEDPRITFVPELNQYVIAYTSYSHSGPGVALALTKDFQTYERLGVVMPPEDKNAALLPYRINGLWAMVHRPFSDIAHMWISYSNDLKHWGDHRLMMEARRGAWWDANRIGLSPPQLRLPKDGLPFIMA